MKARIYSCIIFLSTSYISFSQGVWTKKADFGGVGRYFPVAFSISSKGYIGTGCISGQGSNDFWEYDPSTNTWTQKADYASIHATYAAVGFAIGTKGYIQTRDYNDFWEYDPSTNIWTQKADIGGPAKYGASGFSIGTKGYIGVGGDNTGVNDFWEWDQTTNIWTQKANYGGGVRSFAIGFAIGPKGYFGTGRDGGDHKDFWEYNPVTNVWIQKADFPGGPIQYASAFSIGSKGYVGGGGSNNFWEYNPITDTWTSISTFPGSNNNTAIGFSIGNKGYIGCGQGGTGKDFWEFDPQDSTSNLLNGSVFTDANTNCVMDGGDTPLANWFVEAKNPATTLYGLTNINGSYKIWVPNGTYTVSAISRPYYNQICPVSTYTASVNGQDTVANLNFGTTISNYCPDLAVSIGASTFRRCMKNNYYVQYWNNGTTVANNTILQINFDPGIIPLSSTIPCDSISGTSYFWKITSIQPNQFASFNLVDSISCNIQLGDTLHVTASLPYASDCNERNNYDEDSHVVIGSFDPNAKEAATTSNKTYIKEATILPTDTINYTIHFQNTGTDTAFTVVVYDTLDSHLNIPSIISGVSSHPYTLELLGTGILKWTFNNIFLPDSTTNELASHGFVKFQILQNPNNTNGTIITNSAGIVFDFNAPVLTNGVELTVNTFAGIQNTLIEQNNITIYPNPTSGVFVVITDAKQYQLEIYNVFGEKIYSTPIITPQPSAIDLSSAPSGIYFLHVQTENGIAVKKIVKQ